MSLELAPRVDRAATGRPAQVLWDYCFPLSGLHNSKVRLVFFGSFPHFLLLLNRNHLNYIFTRRSVNSNLSNLETGVDVHPL